MSAPLDLPLNPSPLRLTRNGTPQKTQQLLHLGDASLTEDKTIVVPPSPPWSWSPTQSEVETQPRAFSGRPRPRPGRPPIAVQLLPALRVLPGAP